MASIAEIIMDGTLPVGTWDFDPQAGTGSALEEFSGLSVTRAAYSVDAISGDRERHYVRNFTLVA